MRWVEILAFSVFTYQQTRSALWVASLMMARMLPLSLFGLAFGAWAARTPLRTALLLTQGLLLLTALALLAVSWRGELQAWHLVLASFVNGVAWAGDLSLRRGLMGERVGDARMAQAMALDSMSSNGFRGWRCSSWAWAWPRSPSCSPRWPSSPCPNPAASPPWGR